MKIENQRYILRLMENTTEELLRELDRKIVGHPNKNDIRGLITRLNFLRRVAIQTEIIEAEGVSSEVEYIDSFIENCPDWDDLAQAIDSLSTDEDDTFAKAMLYDDQYDGW